MDLISEWATKIAEEATPDEVDLAPIMAHAFIRGGRDREEMFRRSKDAVPGGFGPEFGVALFPEILATIQHLQDVGPTLSEFFTSTKDAWAGASSFMSALNILLTIGNRADRKEQAEALPDDPYGPLKNVLASMSQELQDSGVSPEKADLITYRVLRAMLEEPSGAAQFAKRIEAAS
jgi:hypothetical protein